MKRCLLEFSIKTLKKYYMNKIIPGLYLGSLDDSRDKSQLKKYFISHIISVIEQPKEHFPEIKYLCIDELDSNLTHLDRYFNECVEFIHKARTVENGNVLVHCYAGISRSATIIIAYLMTCSDMTFETAFVLVRNARKIANPNFSFQRQLQQYFYLDAKPNRQRLRKVYGEEKWKEDEMIILQEKKKNEKKIQNFTLPKHNY